MDSIEGSHIEFVNPHDEFQSTDIGNGLPSRRLVLLERRGNHWILTYEHGGIGLHTHYVECFIFGDQIRGLRAGIAGKDVNSNERIANALDSGYILFNNFNIKRIHRF
jgi:hypothetical protein